jgi:hypothetical protein
MLTAAINRPTNPECNMDNIHANPFCKTASNFAAELQRPTPGLTERRGVGGGLPRYRLVT